MSPMHHAVVHPTVEEAPAREELQIMRGGFSVDKFFRYAIPVWSVTAVAIGLLFLPLSLPILIYQFFKNRLK